jgi:transcription antitermination factor NusG
MHAAALWQRTLLVSTGRAKSDIDLFKRLTMTMQWYVLRSKPNKEEALHHQLVLRRFEAYCPQVETDSAGLPVRRKKAYFPNYMFVHADLGEVGLSTFQWMPYGAGLVSFAGEPAPISDEIIQALHQRIEALKKNRTEVFMGYQPGSLLKVNTGPFAGYEAIFDTRLPGNDRIRILLNLVTGNEFEELKKARPYKTFLPEGAQPPLGLHSELMEKYRAAMEKYYIDP